jgi:hypothetical protein
LVDVKGGGGDVPPSKFTEGSVPAEDSMLKLSTQGKSFI